MKMSAAKRRPRAMMLKWKSGSGVERTVSFTPGETGAHKIFLRSRTKHNHGVQKANNPICAFADGTPFHILATAADFYFWVPATVRSFAIKTTGRGGGSGVKVAIFDAQGKVVGQQDNIEDPVQFVLDRARSPFGEDVALKCERPTLGRLAVITLNYKEFCRSSHLLKKRCFDRGNPLLSKCSRLNSVRQEIIESGPKTSYCISQLEFQALGLGIAWNAWPRPRRMFLSFPRSSSLTTPTIDGSADGLEIWACHFRWFGTVKSWV